MLGLLIEKASRLSYRDYVQQHVFAPAGMTRSGFLRLDRVYDEVAEGYDPLRDKQGRISGWKKNIYSFPPIGSPDGGAYVTAADLDRFLRQVKAGKLLSPRMTTAFFTPQAFYRERGEWKHMYGYGIEFAVTEAGHVLFAQKEGIYDGTSAIIRHYPDQDINVVLLSNMQMGAWEPLKTIHRLLIAE